MNKFYVALLFVLSTGVLEAQSPGGVSTNLSLWLKPDGLTAGSLATWNYSNNANSFTGAVGQQPTVTANLFNFLPGVNFNGSQFMSGPTGVNAPIPAGQLDYSIFAVWNSSVAVAGASGNMRVWAQRPNAGNSGDANFDGASLFVYPSAQFQGAPFQVSPSPYGDQPETPNYTTGVSFAPAYNTAVLTYTPNTTYISQLNLLNQNTNDLELMDQTNYTTGPGVTSTDPAGLATTHRILTNAGNWLGARSGAGDEPFNGNLAELIVYAGNPTPAQRSAIFSYLSLKYGISLGGDLVSSGGTTIWNSTSAAHWNDGNNYNHNIFGIGKDVASGLTLSHSNSTSTGSGSGAGQSGLGNITLNNPTALTDQGFMLIGSAGLAMTENQTNITPLASAGSFRVGNQWLVQKTGTVGNFDLSFDFTGIAIQAGSTIGNSTNFRLDIDVDGDGNFTTGPQELLEPTSWSGNIATWAGIFMGSASNGTPVVFTVIDDPSGATPLPVNWVSFTGQANGPDVDLNWTVSANEQANVYEVQHSTDGTHFTTIGEVSNLANVQSYGFVHANAGPGTHYYRINEIDHDGKSIYSKIISVNMSGSDFGVRLLNNPVTNNGMDAELEITAAGSGNASLEVWTLSGTRIETLMQSVTTGTTRIRVPMATLPSGTYAVKVRVNDVTQVVQIVKL